MSTTAYIPPGVTVQEFTSPSINPLLALPASICLIGLSAGIITRTDILTLNGTTATLLPSIPTDATMTAGSIVSVMDALNPSLAPNGFSSITDYSFSSSNHRITRQVTTNTLASPASSGQPAFTLTAGPVPAVGQTVRLTNTFTVASVTTTINSSTATVSSGGFPGVAIGMTVSGTGIAPDTTVGGVSGNNLTLSVPATATGVVTLQFVGTEVVTALTVVGQVVTATTNLTYTYPTATTVVAWGPIPDGEQVYVTYTYTPSDYFQPIRLNNMADIQNRFGTAWNSSLTAINSPLSYAAQICFENGASNVVLQPLYATVSGVRQQPTAVQAADATQWNSVYNNLLSLEDINIIVPVVGQSQANVTDSVELQLEEQLQDFLWNLKHNNGIYAVGVVGEDSSASTSVAQPTALTAHALTLQSRYGNDVTQQLVFVNTSKFARGNATGTFLVGGQYMAAAIAGMLAAREPSTSLTRQVVAGFSDAPDFRSKSQKNTDAGNGMLVVESKANVVVVRHAITMDSTSSATRELSVIRAKHFIIESVKTTLDTQIIGRIIADASAPTLVNNVVIATLENLRGTNDLVAYGNVSTRVSSLDPTTLEVRFSYSPAFTINYINIGFSLDLTSGTLTVSSAGSTG